MINKTWIPRAREANVRVRDGHGKRQLLLSESGKLENCVWMEDG